MRTTPVRLTLLMASVGLWNCQCDSIIPGGEEDAGVSSSSSSGGGQDAGTVIDRPDPNRPDNASRDSDCDGLSDQEEFGTLWPGGLRTDPGNPDSDGDGRWA